MPATLSASSAPITIPDMPRPTSATNRRQMGVRLYRRTGSSTASVSTVSRFTSGTRPAPTRGVAGLRRSMTMSRRIETIATNADQKDSEVTDTQSEMVSAPGPNVRHGVRWWGALAFAGSLVVPAVIGFRALHFVPAEKKSYAWLPGDATSAVSRVRTGELAAYRSKGDLLFVTVSNLRLSDLTSELTKDEKAFDLNTYKEVFGDQTPRESEVADRKLMSYSKDFASFVALKHLGYDVKVSGGGVVVAQLACEKAAPDKKTCEIEPPASKLLKPQDLIVAVDGVTINTSNDISTALVGKRKGDLSQVTVDRQGEPEPLVLAIELTQTEGRAIIGFIPDPSPPDTIKFSIPKGVAIDSGDVGGPSAGLAFTLALLDDLTPGSLTGGVKVAATGTMSPSGVVGDIGKLRLKTVAVQRAGAKVFLVPDDQKDEAIKQAEGSDLKVIGVRTIDDALKALADLGGNSLQLGTPGAATGG
jgi:Lon-like protease